ncbi:restriction endonuclease subunit S [Acinetobacter baumannii]|uniref:restriction endonuclease subunit S n=1 Tax=Acinetobacter pittii TaxID=48296 RepID=UPI001F05484F|nr:restriction endonuclease subunit S [Acinetobacter pittii]MCH2013331.1 restriction endonuclease subunit S [Acinetobacter pittii]MCH2018188.1 restriction endonuclease subunit S [Acinetobacter pittii]
MDKPNIPKDWILTTLGTIVDYGKAQKCEFIDISPETWVLELEDIEKDSSKIIQRLYANKRLFKSTKNKFKKGDVLYGKLRPYLNKVVVADDDGVCSTEIVPLNAEPYVYNYFLLHWLKSETFLNYVNEVSYGVNMPRLGTQDALAAPFILPPLDEQKVIADKLNLLLEQVDAIKANLQRIPDILVHFRQSVLVAAMSGKLTEEWRDNNLDHDAINDFKEIQKQRASKIIGKNLIPQKHLSSEEYNIPPSWFWVSLDSLTSQIVDGAHHTPKYIEEGVPFISVKDIKNGRIDFSDTKFIDEKEHIELSKRCYVEKGDLLITKSGTIGRTAIVNTDKEFSLFVSVALLKPASSSVDMRFIDIALQKWVNEIDVSSRIVGSTIKNLHLRDMKVLAIPFPPLKEQEQIISQVEKLFVFAENIERKVSATLERINNLSKSILNKAFSGELTVEWREANLNLISEDKSAQVLLNKIKNKREILKSQPRVRTIRQKEKNTGMTNKLLNVLEEANDWVAAQEAFRLCGVIDGTKTERIEEIYSEIRELDKVGRLQVDTVYDEQGRKLYDRLKLAGV